MDYANPMYDVVFKYLMEDNTQAVRFLSALTGLEIVSVTPMPQEFSIDADPSIPPSHNPQLSVYRLDYAARIQDKQGRILIVLIEIQQEKIQRQDMRFRKYVGKQYLNSASYTLAKTLSGQKYKVGIPILLIYFLGERLEYFEDVPIILLDWAAKDSRTLSPLYGTNHFLEALFHRGLIINVPALNPNGGTALEDVLAIFSPFYKTTNPHLMHMNKITYPPQYHGILRRLQKAAAEDDVRAKMLLEDDFFEEIQFIEEQLADALSEKEAALRKGEEERQQKEAAQRQKERAILLLLDLGIPKAEIGRQLGLSQTEMEAF